MKYLIYMSLVAASLMSADVQAQTYFDGSDAALRSLPELADFGVSIGMGYSSPAVKGDSGGIGVTSFIYFPHLHLGQQYYLSFLLGFNLSQFSSDLPADVGRRELSLSLLEFYPGVRLYRRWGSSLEGFLEIGAGSQSASGALIGHDIPGVPGGKPLRLDLDGSLRLATPVAVGFRYIITEVDFGIGARIMAHPHFGGPANYLALDTTIAQPTAFRLSFQLVLDIGISPEKVNRRNE